MFNEIVDPSGQNDDDSYKALTALGILSAVQSLVKATFNETQVRTGISGVELCVALVPVLSALWDREWVQRCVYTAQGEADAVYTLSAITVVTRFQVHVPITPQEGIITRCT